MQAPVIDIDLFSEATRQDPYPAYQVLRDSGEVCELAGLGLYAVGRHQQVKDILGNWEDFSSASGVALNALMNQLMAGTVLTSDPPEHKRLRDMLARPLSPARLAELRLRLAALADKRVAELIGAGRVDAMPNLAMLLPINIISEMVGLPEEGREQMLDWAAAAFNGMAAEGLPLCDQAFPVMLGMVDYITSPDLPSRLKPGSWAADLWQFVEGGQLGEEEFRSIIQGYVSPSLDTTIFSIGNLLWLLATNPEQWRRLKENPSMISRCINESLRIESPALGFSRVAQRDVEIGQVAIPKGSRIVTVLPSANRDERRYERPDTFDIGRDASDHLAFGGGIHRCVGGNLAMLEITAILTSIVKQVESIKVHDFKRADNAVLRGFAELQIELA